MINTTRLKELRLERGLTQQDLADLCNLGQCSYSLIETGKRKAGTVATLMHLLNGLNRAKPGVTPNDLLDLKTQIGQEEDK